VVNTEFVEMLSALSDSGAEFLVIGAHALAVHGIPRATGGFDIWVRPTEENAGRVLEALRVFGAPLFDLSREDLANPGIVFQIGVAPGRIDILTGVSGLTFEEAWPGRVSTSAGGQEVPVIGRAELIRNKRATGRLKDLADVEALEGARE